MKSSVVILLLAAATLWVDQLCFRVTPHDADLHAFEAGTRALFPELELEERPFAKNPMIPDRHVHLMSEDLNAAGDLLSVYFGHYPELVFGADSTPHDPELCYGVLGYETLGPAQTLHVVDGDELRAIRRVSFGGTGENGERVAFTAFYWTQFAGHMPGAEEGLPEGRTRTLVRYQEGRSDLGWIRVEYLGGSVALDERRREELLALMHLASDAMR